MRIRSRVLTGLCASITALAAVSACGSHGGSGGTSSGASPTTSAPSAAPAPTVAAPPMTLGPETHKWVDLKVGDCIAEVPAVDLGAVTVALVDCTAPHAAEVYQRSPLPLNAAVTEVANRECVAGLPDYIGVSFDASPYSVTYLIDSNQDRTSDNPLPSTVICLLQSSSGEPLVASAHRH
jgi:hypothetical protein